VVDLRAEVFRESLLAGGECGRLIASADWSATALGPLHGWPPSLRTATLILLRSPVPMVMLWGEDGVMLYNDAYSAFAGGRHPQLLGSKVREGWPEVAEFNDNVMRVGLAGGTLAYRDQELTLCRHGRPEQVWMNLDYSPVPGEDGTPAGVLAIVVETTERVAAERRQAFLVALSDTLRDLTDAGALTATAAERLGRHLDVGRAGYGEIDAVGEIVAVARDWTDGTMVSLAGEARVLDAFGPEVIAELRAGHTLVVEDCLTDPRTARPEYLGTWESIGTRALIVVPMRDKDRLAAILYVHSAVPRRWSDLAVRLVEDVGGRTWAAVERARAEAQLRASQERLSRSHAAARLGDFTWDVATDAITLSGEYPRLLGLAPRALPTTASAFLELIHPEDRRRVEAEAAPMLAGDGARLDTEYRLVRGSGEIAWIAANATSEGRLPDGRAARVVGVNYDVTDRRRAEASLRESEARLRLAAEVSGFGTYQYDILEDRHTWSRATYRIYGLEEGAPIGLAMIAALTHPEDRPRADAELAAALAARRPELAVEYRIVRPDGVVRHVALRSRIDYADGEAPQPVRIVGAVQDVTVQREAERELQALVAQRTAERDRIWQLSVDLMCVARTDGTLLSVNPAWERLLGWPTDWLTGRKAAEIKHPDDAERTTAELGRLAAGGHRTINFEDRYRHRDGSWRWISWTIEPEGDLIYCIGRDVTAEKAAREALAAAEAARREADALYRAYFEYTPEALFVIGVEADGGFVIEQLNPAHEAGVGLMLADVRGKRIEDVLSPDIAARVLDHYRRVVAMGEPYQYREVFGFDAGPQHWDTALVPVRDDEGRITRLIGSSRNVTRQVIAEDALRQAQKMEAVGQLTGGIAHDFNNLLGAVVGSLDLIRRKPTDVERVRRFAEAGLDAAERGAKLTGQLLAFSRAQRIELKSVVVSHLVGGMRDLLARTLGPMVRLAFDLEGDGAALSDPTQLEMAVLNLAINARDAMPDGGDLTIATRLHRMEGTGDLAAGEYVELSVSDTGTGMPSDVVARAFDPFFTTKGVGRGTGLGLSQVYGIAKQAGGTVRIDSRLGVGTTVRIYLPRTGAPVRTGEEPEAKEAAISDSTATILVIDDDPDVRRMLVASLDALNYRVIEADDGLRGLAALDEGSPDLMMVDFAMPGMNGAEVAKAAREKRPDLPIVFASGYADTAAIEAVTGDDIFVLRKPFRVGDLQAVLAEALLRRPVSGGGRGEGG
jgi:PAS domain S-box-containing protein